MSEIPIDIPDDIEISSKKNRLISMENDFAKFSEDEVEKEYQESLLENKKIKCAVK